MIRSVNTIYRGLRSAFTMMEIMTVMAIISVFASITVPALDNFNSGNKVKGAAEVFVQNIRLAKYRSISDKAVHRLVFSSDRMYYKVQSYIGDNEDYSGFLNRSTAGIDDLDSDYNSINWESVTDTEEIEIESGVEINFDGNFPEVLYFWINGTLVEHDGVHTLDGTHSPIGEITVSFKYGSAAIRVLVNALGVFSSESYSADEDTDPTNDEVLW